MRIGSVRACRWFGPKEQGGGEWWEGYGAKGGGGKEARGPRRSNRWRMANFSGKSRIPGTYAGTSFEISAALATKSFVSVCLVRVPRNHNCRHGGPLVDPRPTDRDPGFCGVKEHLCAWGGWWWYLQTPEPFFFPSLHATPLTAYLGKRETSTRKRDVLQVDEFSRRLPPRSLSSYLCLVAD